MTMKRFLPLALLALAACASGPRSIRGMFVPVPEPLPASISALASGDPVARDRAAEELLAAGRDPARQNGAVEALRTAAQAVDPEVRATARRLLGMLARDESRVPREERRTFAVSEPGGGRLQVEFHLARFADGSGELRVRLVEGRAAEEELFSGRSVEELAAKVVAAARARGYDENAFQLDPDGRLKLGSGTYLPSEPWNADRNRLAELGLWLERVPPDWRGIPPEARGAWVVRARTIDGRGFRDGILRGDVAVAEGRILATIADVREAHAAGVLAFRRPELVAVPEGGPPPGEADARPPVLESGTLTLRQGELQVEWALELKARLDGRLELRVKENGADWPAIEAKDWPGIRDGLNAAAERRGPGAPRLGESEGLLFGNYTLPWEPSRWIRDHSLPELGAWVDRAEAQDGFGPAAALGGWWIEALLPGGPAGKRGLREGDLLMPEAPVPDPASLAKAWAEGRVKALRYRLR